VKNVVDMNKRMFVKQLSKRLGVSNQDAQAALDAGLSLVVSAKRRQRQLRLLRARRVEVFHGGPKRSVGLKRTKIIRMIRRFLRVTAPTL